MTAAAAAAAATAAAGMLDELLRLLVVEYITKLAGPSGLQFVSVRVSSIHAVDLLGKKEPIHRIL